MKTGKLFYFMAVLTCVCFVTCENPIMAKWWPEKTEEKPTEAVPAPRVHEDNYFIVSFNANGGSPAPLYQKIAPGGKVAKIQAVSRTGYGFGGWYTDEDFTNEWNFDTDTVNTGDIVLNAKWVSSANSRIVTFITNTDTNISHLNILESQIIAQGAKITEPPAIIKTGYGFGGWYTDGYAYPPPGYSPVNNDHPNYFNDQWDFSTRTVGNTDITLYAKWDVPYYTVTFDAGGGSPAPAPQELLEGAKVVEPFAVSKEGHGFGGWYKDSGFTVPWNFSTDKMSAANITLYAKWVAAWYTVIFEADGGTPAPNAQIIQYGTKAAVPPAVAKPYNGFGGWYTDPSFHSNRWDFDVDIIKGDLTLYAKWETGIYTVTFVSNGGTPVPPQTIYQSSGAKIAKPAGVSRPGYELDGWYKSSGLAFADWWDFSSAALTTDMILYAKWIPNAPAPVDPEDPDLVWIPTGTFIMGDNGVSGAKPEHKVTVNGFYMDKYEVNQDGFFNIAGTRPSNSSHISTRPVERVSWYDAVEYCNKLSELKGLQPAYTITGIVRTPIQGTGTPGILSITSASVTVNWNAGGYRLPTEAEWEYAAKGGGLGPYLTYAGSDDPAEVAWYNQTASGVTHPVGLLAPNSFGLYDMCGNVSEWCWDWFDSGYYTVSPQDNPKGPASGTERVRRGGAWSNAYSNIRSVVRNSFPPDNNTWVMGFRVIRPYTP